MPPARSDEERAEFDRAALPHLDHVYGSALYLARDPHRAADLVQETYLRAFRFFHQFTPGTNCLAWLLTILHNTFRNRYRSEGRTRGHLDVDDPVVANQVVADAADEPERRLLAGLLDREVADALATLPEEFRSAVVLVDLQDLTYEDAARVLECPIGTIRSRLSRGRKLLAHELSGYARERGYTP